MAVKRAVYAIVLLACAAVFVVTNNAVALFLCVCAAALPPLSFVLLLFAAKRLRFDCETRRSCIRGGALQITVRAGLSPRFLAGCAVAEVEIENSTFGKKQIKKMVFKDLSFGAHTYDYVSEDSGRICVRIKSLKVTDILGICSLKVGCGKFTESVVSPLLYENLRVRVGANMRSSLSGETSLPQKGSDITEIFNVRDYVAGDSLNSVHWKLSSKFDSLKAKEFGSTDEHKTLVLVDMSRKKGEFSAADASLNAVLDIAVSVSDSLKESGCVHSIGWFNDGELFLSEVSDGNTFVQSVNALMSVKADAGSSKSLFYLSRSEKRSAFTKVILVTAAVTAEELKEFSGSSVTVIAVGDSLGQVDEGDVRIIYVTQERAQTALVGCTL